MNTGGEMILENKRLQKLAGILSEGSVNESAEDMVHHFGDGKDEGDAFTDPAELNANDDELGTVEEAVVRAKVRYELEKMWSSGQVHNKPVNRGGITLGFKGPGFR